MTEVEITDTHFNDSCGRLGFAAVLIAVIAVSLPLSVMGQYDWSHHLGPRMTGFELARFGTWDLEPAPFRGMVDRHYYEAKPFASAGVRKVEEVTSATLPDSTSGQVFRQSVSYVDRSGKIIRIEYLDPLTHKVVQRETFNYDTSGHLVEWRRARPPSAIAIAPLTRTLYPDRGPYGMAQQFVYSVAGVLREWHACTLTEDQHLEKCDEDFLLFDDAGRIVRFGWSQESYELTRDTDGNVTAITDTGTGEGEPREMAVRWSDDVLVEEPKTADDERSANRAWFDDDGNIVQYRVPLKNKAEAYWTATWARSSGGRPVSVQKGLDTYSFDYDAAGRLVSIEQSLLPRVIRRSFDGAGRIVSQSPPFFYRRLDPSGAGEEKYAYGPGGELESVRVTTADGMPVATVSYRYLGRRQR